MSIIQFLRIFWAYRWLPVVTTIAAALGALVVVLLVPPSYQARSRVQLNTLKPDPVTGEVIGTQASRVYVGTQIELIKDFGVAGRAVDQLGWMQNQQLVNEYMSTRNPSLDLRRWLAQRIIDKTIVNQVSGTNILEIVFRANTPNEAKAMADALREAYLNTVLDARRQEANRNADWFAQQALKAQAQLQAADAAKTAYEKESGIVMQGDTDVDTARLQALSMQGVGVGSVALAPAITLSAADIQLAQIDAQIALAAKTLGPNHPQMIELGARRATVQKLAIQDRAAQQSARSAAAGAASATVGLIDNAVKSQTARVIAKREEIMRLTQLQGEVNLRRDQFNRLTARATDLRQEGAVADTGMSPLGYAVAPSKPTFPNKPLILGGATGLGFAFGILLALLLELFGRKVRGVEDLQNGFDIPLLAVVRPARSLTSPSRGWLGFIALPNLGRLGRA